MSMINKITLKRIRQITLSLLCVLSLFFVIIPPIINTFADDAQSTISNGYSDYAGDNKTTVDVMGNKLAKEKHPTTRADKFYYVFARLMIPGYINNVQSAVGNGDWDSNVYQEGDTYLCHHSAPGNLIGYNCDIPNLSAQILQAIARVFVSSGVINGERVSAQPNFGLGVPNNIPGSSVPTDQSARTYKYTGLEAFGYNMKWTSYNGEWDDIIPSTSARMLANYGALDKIKVASQSLWNGASSGLHTFIDSASLNPFTWWNAAAKAWESSTSASFLTVFDTSDANIAATHAWTRSGNSVASSFYRVYVLSDKQVINISLKKSTEYMAKILDSLMGGNPEIKELNDMKTPPVFKYVKKTTDAFNQKKAKAEKEAADAKSWNESHPDDKKDVPSIPTPGKDDYQSEADQFKEWLSKNSLVQKGKSKNIDVTDAKDYNTMKSEWNDKWHSAMTSLVNNIGGPLMSSLIKSAQKDMEKSYIYGNPQEAISHYVCAHKDGTPYVDSSGNYIYLYTAQNGKTTEHLNPACSANLPIRPTIQGGYFGDGYAAGSTTDTRNVAYNETSLLKLIPIVGDISGGIQGICTFLIRMIAQITNEMLNLSFSPLMKQLGITTIVKVGFTNLKDSIFYPLLGLVISFAGIMMFVNVVRSFSMIKFLSTFLIMLLVFFTSITIFNNPDKFIDKTEEIPLYFENSIAKAMLKSGVDDSLCNTGNSDNSGVRSAQCYVWKDTVFNPWVYGQFGTGYSNLYPNNSYGLSHGNNHFNNKNQELVGDPQVNLGGGKNVSNWALYQLSLITSGTITTPDTTNAPGVVDRNLYRLVDLQAGPDNAKNSDARYWQAWTGRDSNRTLIAFLALILSITSLIAIGKLLITKIELTFLMSIMVLGLPVMLLFGLTPKGQLKLKGYLTTMFSLILKRVVLVVLLCALLRVFDFSISDSSTSFVPVFIAAETILLFFIIYKPEIMKLFHFDDEDLFGGSGLLSGDPDEVRRVISAHTPLTLKNELLSLRGRTRGFATGLLGGAVGAYSGTKAQINQKLKDPEFIKDNDLKSFASKEGFKAKEMWRNAPSSMLRNAISGARESTNYQNKRTDRFITRHGLSKIQQLSRVKRRIEKESSQRILTGEDTTQETFKNVVRSSKYGKNYTTNGILSNSDKKLVLNNPKLQGQLRKIANNADKTVKLAGTYNVKGQKAPLAVASKAKDEITPADKLSNRLDTLTKRKALHDKLRHPIKYNDDNNDEYINLDKRMKDNAIKVDTDVESLKKSVHDETVDNQFNGKDNEVNNDNSKMKVYSSSQDVDDKNEQAENNDNLSNNVKDKLTNNLNVNDDDKNEVNRIVKKQNDTNTTNSQDVSDEKTRTDDKFNSNQNVVDNNNQDNKSNSNQNVVDKSNNKFGTKENVVDNDKQNDKLDIEKNNILDTINNSNNKLDDKKDVINKVNDTRNNKSNVKKEVVNKTNTDNSNTKYNNVDRFNKKNVTNQTTKDSQQKVNKPIFNWKQNKTTTSTKDNTIAPISPKSMFIKKHTETPNSKESSNNSVEDLKKVPKSLSDAIAEIKKEKGNEINDKGDAKYDTKKSK